MEHSHKLGVKYLAVALFAMASGCATVPPATKPVVSGPVVPKPQSVPVQAQTPATPPVTATSLDPALEARMLASLVLPNPRRSLTQVLAYVRPHLPQQLFRRLLDPARIEANLSRLLRVPGALAQLDMKRPVAVGWVAPAAAGNPAAQRKWVVTALPLANEAGLRAVLAKWVGKEHSLGGGRYSFGPPGRPRLYVELADRYAYLTPQAELAGVARLLLRPRLSGKADLLLRVHIDRIYRTYRTMVDLGLALAANAGSSSLAWLQHLRSAKAATVALSFDKTEVVLDSTLSALDGGGLQRHISTIARGPFWGASLLPADPLLLWGQHEEAMGAARQAQIFKTLSAAGGAWASVIKLLQPLLAMASQFERLRTGASAGGITAGPRGLVWTTAVALKVGSADEARRVTRRSARLIARRFKQAWRVALAGIKDKALGRQLRRLAPRLRFRPGGVRADGLVGDVLELSLRWPKLERPGRKKDKSAHALALTGAVLTHLFGKTLRLVTGVFPTAEGPVVMSFVARDSKGALAQLAARVKSKGKGPNHKLVAGRLGALPMRAYGFISITRMIEQVLPTLTHAQLMPVQVGTVLRRVLPPVGSTKLAPMDGWLEPRPGQLRVRLRFSRDIMEMAARLAQLMFTIGSYGGAGPVPPTP